MLISVNVVATLAAFEYNSAKRLLRSLAVAIGQPPLDSEKTRRAELYIQLPPDWKYLEPTDKYWGWPHYCLRWVTQYAHQSGSWLGGPATFIANGEPPEPIAPGTKFTTLLLTPDSNSWGNASEQIALYRVMPLYSEEQRFGVESGIESLMLALDKAHVSQIVDMNRSSVAL